MTSGVMHARNNKDNTFNHKTVKHINKMKLTGNRRQLIQIGKRWRILCNHTQNWFIQKILQYLPNSQLPLIAIKRKEKSLNCLFLQIYFVFKYVLFEEQEKILFYNKRLFFKLWALSIAARKCRRKEEKFGLKLKFPYANSKLILINSATTWVALFLEQVPTSTQTQ